MRCRNIERLLPELYTDGLTAAETAEVTHHLVECEHCSQQAEHYRLLFSRIARTDRTANDEVDWSTFGVRLNKRLDAPESGFTGNARPVYAYAAAALLVVALLGVLISGVLREALSPDEVMYSEIEGALGAEVVQTLPYESIDDVVVLTGGVDAIGRSIVTAPDLFDTETADEIDGMLLATLDGEILMEDNLEYLSHSEALGLLSDIETDDILKTLESKTFINN